MNLKNQLSGPGLTGRWTGHSRGKAESYAEKTESICCHVLSLVIGGGAVFAATGHRIHCLQQIAEADSAEKGGVVFTKRLVRRPTTMS